MTPVRCQFCKEQIQWQATRLGPRLPFNYRPVRVTELQLGDEPWIPGRWKRGSLTNTLMAPLSQYSERVQRATTQVYLVHSCEGMQAARRDREPSTADTDSSGGVEEPIYRTNTSRRTR